MSEKLCLQWNKFKDNVVSSFGSFREDQDFPDVTLACEDGKHIEAHRIILASSSPFFENLLRISKHSHPLIYMRGVRSEVLNAVLDFLYFGEVKVFQESLDSFLAIAEELKLKGLTGENSNADEGTKETDSDLIMGKKDALNPSQDSPENSHEEILTNENDKAGDLKFFGALQELNDKSSSLMGKTYKRVRGYPLYKCKVCEKTDVCGNLKMHIEANHLEGISIPCNKCEKTFRYRDAIT